MKRYRTITWLTKPWIVGLFTFLLLATVCLYVAWSLNNHKSLQAFILISVTGIILCGAGAIIAVYMSKMPVRLQKLVSEKTAELDKSEKRNKAIVNALPDMVFVIDRDGHYVDFNNPVGHQTIVNPDHFIFRKVSDILPGPLATEAMTYVEKVLQTGDVLSHSYQMEAEGEICSYESRYVPHRKDDVMVLVRDTTEAKKAEQRIKESESDYRMLVEQATDSIFIANFQGSFLVVNPAGCKMSQYSEEELLKMRFHDLAIADELKVMPFKLAEIASGQISTSERKMLRKDGEIIDVEISARIIAPNRFLAFVRDITERKKVENELIKSREQLRELTNYIENIREEERLKISREIHEELGQQLTVLKIDVSRLGKKITGMDDSLTASISELLNSINEMVETVRKISSELRPCMLDDIGLAATLDWYCDDFSTKTGIKATFISDMADDKFPKKLNTGIFRILQESLTNVIMHSQAKKVDVSLICHDHNLVLLIEDNGKGFDPSATNDKTLGIQVMKERAMLMNGTYNVYSTSGKGTIIEVCVPLNTLN